MAPTSVPFVQGSWTSKAAATAQVTSGSANDVREQIFLAVSQSGEVGRTCDEVEVELGILHQTASARIKELISAGRLVDAKFTRPTRTGSPARVVVDQIYASPSQTAIVIPTKTASGYTPPVTWLGLQGAKYQLIQTMDQFNRFIGLLKAQPIIAVDTETSGLDWVRDHACGLVFGWGLDHNYYLAINHVTGEDQLSLDEIRGPLREVLENPNVQKIFWNEVFDRHFLSNAGIMVQGLCLDGICLVHLLDEEAEKGLKEVSCKYIDRRCDKWEKEVDRWRNDEAKRRRKEFSQLLKNTYNNKRLEIEETYRRAHPQATFTQKPADVRKKHRQMVKEMLKDHPWASVKKTDISYDQVPLQVLAPYACADVHYTWVMFRDLYAQVMSHDGLKILLKNEIELSQTLYEVETRGVKIDVPYLQSLIGPFKQEIAEAEKEVYASIGYEFDIDSNEQLIKALQKAGCHLTKLTKKGRDKQQKGLEPLAKEFSVDNEVLESLAATYDFAHKIQTYREKRKMLKTYVNNIIKLVDENHYLHSRFNANVATGRMSSSDPNVQNIPGKNKDIRRAFTVPEVIGFEGQGSDEYVFVFADYSQVELRLTAHWSQDPTLLAAYSDLAPGWIGKEQDVHTITLADVVLSRPLAEVQAILKDESHPENAEVKWRRNIAKRVNFGIIYGAGPGAIQRQVSTPQKFVSRDECKLYIDKYLQKYQGVNSWIQVTQLHMRRTGFLRNTFGRYRRLPLGNSKQKWERERAGRQGVNFLIQGDAADLFKQAVVRVRNFLREQNAKTKIVNFVHDEIQFYWHKDEYHLLRPVKELMEDFPQFRIPIIAEFAVSRRDWAGKKELKH